MTIFYDPEYERLSDLTAPYWTYDEEKRKFIIPEDAPKEIHEAAKKTRRTLGKISGILKLKMYQIISWGKNGW